jgi:plastocyanin
MKLTLPSAALCAGLVALAVTGCGSSSNKTTSSSAAQAPAPTTAATPTTPAGGGASTTPAGGGAATNVALSADPSGQLKFDSSSLTAKAGKVTITMTNPSPVTHAVGVSGNGVDKDGSPVGMGGKSSVTVTLKPGKYTFYCPVDGHRQAGMQGTLTVK